MSKSKVTRAGTGPQALPEGHSLWPLSPPALSRRKRIARKAFVYRTGDEHTYEETCLLMDAWPKSVAAILQAVSDQNRSARVFVYEAVARSGRRTFACATTDPAGLMGFHRDRHRPTGGPGWREVA